jgi:uncharacterized small protein (DUF1192 family)
MFDDDLEPRKPKKVLKKLEPLSLDELADYISEMNEEIQRAELEISRKKAHMNAASTLFKSK